MASYQKQLKTNYPIGSISSGTTRNEDLIPAFVSELEYRLKHGPKVSRETRKAHNQLVRDVNTAMENDNPDLEPYFDSEDAGYDLESLFDALNEYAGPYFYFGAHPGDGADYGYWLSEDWDAEFETLPQVLMAWGSQEQADKLKVDDFADVPAKFRGEVAVVNDHGNVTLYVKTSRTLREIWAVV